MASIRPSYCYAQQKFGSSISAGSFIALISQSNAVGSRKSDYEGLVGQLKKNIGTQGVQELFFVNKKPLKVLNGAYQSIVKP